MHFQRSLVADLVESFQHAPSLIQVIVGPRQVGKTTAALAVVDQLGWPSIVAAADAPLPPGPEWIETQWRLARLQKKEHSKVILVLDEIQKVRGWSEVVKRLWDEEKRSRGPVRPLLLGSSALLVEQGLTESLAGRFFLHRCMHWSWAEQKAAFGVTFDDWLYFGGYPGAMEFRADEKKWKQYVSDSLIETILSRDVLQLQSINKPVLLRHLFALASSFPSQIFSYNKMLGQLHDAGNTTTLANYLKLLEKTYLVSGLEQYSKNRSRKRGSSPKLILWNNALIHAQSSQTKKDVVQESTWRGRIIENAVGAQFLNQLRSPEWSITYWREGNLEVDFVVEQGKNLWALEVKSGRSGKQTGMTLFKTKYPHAKGLIIGSGGVPLETFFETDPLKWFQ